MKLTHITTVPVSLRFLRGQVSFLRARGFHIDATLCLGRSWSSSVKKINVHAVEMPRSVTPVHDLRAGYQIFRKFRGSRAEIARASMHKSRLHGIFTGWLAWTPVRSYHIRGLPNMSDTRMQHIPLKATERISCLLAHREICVSHLVRRIAAADGLCPSNWIPVVAGDCSGDAI